jgi:hypothetical protein
MGFPPFAPLVFSAVALSRPVNCLTAARQILRKQRQTSRISKPGRADLRGHLVNPAGRDALHAASSARQPMGQLALAGEMSGGALEHISGLVRAAQRTTSLDYIAEFTGEPPAHIEARAGRIVPGGRTHGGRCRPLARSPWPAKAHRAPGSRREASGSLRSPAASDRARARERLEQLRARCEHRARCSRPVSADPYRDLAAQARAPASPSTSAMP